MLSQRVKVSGTVNMSVLYGVVPYKSVHGVGPIKRYFKNLYLGKEEENS